MLKFVDGLTLWVRWVSGAYRMIFEDLIGVYLASKSHRSKRRDMYSLKRLQPHFGGKSVIGLKRGDVRSYVTVRLADGVQESTVLRELRFFSAAINFVRIEHDRPDLPNPVVRLGAWCRLWPGSMDQPKRGRRSRSCRWSVRSSAAPSKLRQIGVAYGLPKK